MLSHSIIVHIQGIEARVLERKSKYCSPQKSSYPEPAIHWAKSKA